MKAISLSYLQEKLIMKSFASSSHYCPRSFLPANKTTEAATFWVLWTQILLSKTTCYFITSEVRGWRGKNMLWYLLVSPHASAVLWMNYNLPTYPQKKNGKQHFSFHIIWSWNCQRGQKKSASLFSQLLLIKSLIQHQIKAIIFASRPQKNNWRTKKAKIVTWVRTDSRILGALLPSAGVKGG